MSTEPSSRPAFIAASILPTAHPLTLIHRSAWKGYSPKSRCRILHRSPSRATRKASEGPHTAGATTTSYICTYETQHPRTGASKDRYGTGPIGPGRRRASGRHTAPLVALLALDPQRLRG